VLRDLLSSFRFGLAHLIDMQTPKVTDILLDQVNVDVLVDPDYLLYDTTAELGDAKPDSISWPDITVLNKLLSLHY